MSFLKSLRLWSRVIISGIRLMGNPNRIEDVIKIANIIFSPEDLDCLEKKCREISQETVDGRSTPQLPPRAELLKMPDGSLGKEYVHFLMKNNLDPKVFPIRDNEKVSVWLSNYFYTTHDIWHVVSGFDTSDIGELRVQAFCAGQVPSPLANVIIGLGLIRSALPPRHPRANSKLIDSLVDAFVVGRNAKPLFGIDWNQKLTLQLSQIRTELRIHTDSSCSADELAA